MSIRNGRMLEGVRVLEWAEGVAASFCGKVLRDLGADVVKVERPRGGDPGRYSPPLLPDAPAGRQSALFAYLNGGKRSVTLDPAVATGSEVLRRLAEGAVLFLHDRPLPSTLDSAALTGRGLVRLSVLPFGAQGPHAGYAAYPLTTFHAGGEGYLLPAGHDVSRPPAMPAGLVGELEAGYVAGVAALSGIYRSLLTGQGQEIDVSVQEALLSLQRMDVVRYPNEGVLEDRTSRVYDVGGPMAAGSHEDYVVLMFPEEHQWRRLVELMGNPEWTRDPAYQDRAGRLEHAEEVNAHIQAWLLEQDPEDLYHRAQQIGLPLGNVAWAEDLLRSPQLQARQFFVPLPGDGAERYQVPRLPVSFADFQVSPASYVPEPGEHTRQILNGELGYQDAVLVEWSECGVI